MNDDSLDDLRFFDKPVEEFVDKKDAGFKKGKEPLKQIESDEKEDSESKSNSFAKPRKSDFNPVAQYLQKPKKGKEEQANVFRQTPNDSSQGSSANSSIA